MLGKLYEYLYGLIFGFLIFTILIILLICITGCYPIKRNSITKNKIPEKNSENEETIFWLDSILSNEPIHSAIRKKITSVIQSQITYFSSSSDCQSILKNISVISTKFPSIKSSRVKSSIKNDNTLVTTLSIKLDSPIIVTTSSFVNSLGRDVISDISITQIDPTITLTIPYNKGIVKADIDLGVDAEVDVNSAEPIDAGDDVLKGIFIKTMRRLDIKFDDSDDDIFNENSTRNPENADLNKDHNKNNEDDENFEEEEEENIDNFNTVLTCDSYAQTINRGKIDLAIPPYSVSVTAVLSDQDLLTESSKQRKKDQTKENQTQTEQISSSLSISKERKNQINIKPDESLLNQRKKKDNEKEKEKEKAKLSIAKNRSSCFEAKQQNQVHNTIHSEEIFELLPDEPKIEEEEDVDEDDNFDEESVTSTIKVGNRKLTLDFDNL
ncbi:hypothetical protein M9Y10_009957 [Tritrichomonas musculus]|uniref:SMP-LTD domain-containing protein n=1 Tax=Tritrichomonas musculus TaxID=1915356 RepID=A0ABR2IQQ8_9EUKA